MTAVASLTDPSLAVLSSNRTSSLTLDASGFVGIGTGLIPYCDQFFDSFKRKHNVDLEPILLDLIKQHYPEYLV